MVVTPEGVLRMTWNRANLFYLFLFLFFAEDLEGMGAVMQPVRRGNTHGQEERWSG
jgi:hypothetical protein